MSFSTTTDRNRTYNPVIEVDNVIKHFGVYNRWRPVLRKFNLTAFPGEIYVLLGPHGCGKSTALNVILGLKSVTHGHVKVFGFKPGCPLSGIPGMRVGYTPQCLGLYEQLTVLEILRYYALVLGLKGLYVEERILFLSNLLRLPNDNSMLRNCNEGLKRQVSFGIALIHEPELLVLDEPTSGVDPVLRHSIWEHLHHMVKKTGNTILVTTDNSLDASKAHRLGIMRNGYMLVEDSPKKLLSRYKEANLVALYKKIYDLTYAWALKSTTSVEENPLIQLERVHMTGSEGFLYVETTEDQHYPGDRKKSTVGDYIAMKARTLVTTCMCINFRRLGIVMIRDLVCLIRAYMWLCIILIMPAVFTVFFGFTVGTAPGNVRVAVVNREATQTDCIDSYSLMASCQMINMIDRSILRIQQYSNHAKAMKAAQNLEVDAVLKFGSKFTDKISSEMSNDMIEFSKRFRAGDDELSPEEYQLVVYLDLTSRVVSNAVKNHVEGILDSYLQNTTITARATGMRAASLLMIEKAIFGSVIESDTGYMVPGFSVTLAFHLSAVLAAVTLVTNRKHKVTDRDYLAGVRFIETVVSLIITYGLVVFLSMVLTFIIIFLVMNLPFKGSYFTLTIIILMQIWCGLCFGILVSIPCRSPITAAVLVFCSLICSIIISGILWPLQGLPSGVISMVEFLPQTYAATALRNVILRGIHITHPKVYLGLLIPLAWLILFVSVCAVINKVSY